MKEYGNGSYDCLRQAELQALKGHQECSELFHSHFMMLECNDLILEFINVLHSLTSSPTQILQPLPSSSCWELHRSVSTPVSFTLKTLFLLLPSVQAVSSYGCRCFCMAEKGAYLGAQEEELENEWNVYLGTIYGSNLSKKTYVHRVQIQQKIESESKSWE